MTKKERLIYLAGIVDGEGYMGIIMSKPGRRTKKYPAPRLVVTSTYMGLMDWLEKYYGGRVGKHSLSKLSKKECWEWTVGHSKCEALLKELLPYLIIKKEKARSVIKDMEQYRSRL